MAVATIRIFTQATKPIQFFTPFKGNATYQCKYWTRNSYLLFILVKIIFGKT